MKKIIWLIIILVIIYSIFSEDKEKTVEPKEDKLEKIDKAQKVEKTESKPVKQKEIKPEVKEVVKVKPKEVVKKVASIKSIKPFSGSVSGDIDGKLNQAKYNYPTVLSTLGNKLYVLDEGNKKLKVIDGNKVESIVLHENRKVTSKRKEIKINKMSALYVDNNKELYVIDFWKNNIYKFDSDGRFKARVNAKSSVKLNGAMSIAQNSKGRLYIADTKNHQLKYVDDSGVMQNYSKSTSYGDLDGNIKLAKFDNPSKILFDKDDKMYVLDSGSGKIRIINNDKVSTLKVKNLTDDITTFTIDKNKLYLYSNKSGNFFTYSLDSKKLKVYAKDIKRSIGEVYDITMLNGSVILSSPQSAKLYKMKIS